MSKTSELIAYQRIYREIIDKIRISYDSFTYSLPVFVETVETYNLTRCLMFCMIKLRAEGHNVRFEKPNFIYVHMPAKLREEIHSNPTHVQQIRHNMSLTPDQVELTEPPTMPIPPRQIPEPIQEKQRIITVKTHHRKSDKKIPIIVREPIKKNEDGIFVDQDMQNIISEISKLNM